MERYESGGMFFEWDDEKNRKNIQKHGVTFKNATKVFRDPNRFEKPDIWHSDYEERYLSIGLVKKIIVVIHTARGEDGKTIRLISARIATREERRLYYEQNRENRKYSEDVY